MKRLLDKFYFEDLGFTAFGTLSEKRRLHWEIQFLALVRSFSDGLTIFTFKANWDRYTSDHTPAFQMELVFFNVYSQLMIYQNNFDADRDTDKVHEA